MAIRRFTAADLDLDLLYERPAERSLQPLWELSGLLTAEPHVRGVPYRWAGRERCELSGHAVPSWTPWSVHATTEVDLVSTSDAPALDALGLMPTQTLTTGRTGAGDRDAGRLGSTPIAAAMSRSGAVR